MLSEVYLPLLQCFVAHSLQISKQWVVGIFLLSAPSLLGPSCPRVTWLRCLCMSVLCSGRMTTPCVSTPYPMSSSSQTNTTPSASPIPTVSVSTRYEVRFFVRKLWRMILLLFRSNNYCNAFSFVRAHSQKADSVSRCTIHPTGLWRTGGCTLMFCYSFFVAYLTETVVV